MAKHIPFVNGPDACALVSKYYADSEIIRIPLEKAEDLRANLPTKAKLWVDAGIDGLDEYQLRLKNHKNLVEKRKAAKEELPKLNSWMTKYITQFQHFNELVSLDFQRKPDKKKVFEFVQSVLNKCSASKPSWITIPQMPFVDGTEKNAINRALAQATGQWRKESAYSGKMILPLIFTNQNHVNTGRSPKIEQAVKCFGESKADGIWVVDQSLNDETGGVTIRNKRFISIIALHEELAQKIPSPEIRVGGPYWGLNLVLRVRGAIDFAAIGVGSSYQYHLSGGQGQLGNATIAIAALRRRVTIGPQTSEWLDSVIKILSPSHASHSEFVELRRQLPSTAREQVARTYKSWYDKIGAVPADGRPMAMFQDLTSAFSLGRTLPDIPNLGPTRRPEAIAESLMLRCL